MVEAGEKFHIKVCSIASFEQTFFDFKGYVTLRESLPFGSAINSKTGKNDDREFISVKYIDLEKDKSYEINSIAKSLQKGSSVILTGDYGTGKSRCARELFSTLKASIRQSAAYPLAINLRDHWSSSSALEIIAGHLGNVGLGSSVDNVIRLLNSGHLILLLDGFDEIGTQIHDTRIEDRCAVRKRALQGVRDLIQRAKGGVLITGRSHFFDSTEEMIESLGLGTAHELSCLEAPENFSDTEGAQYLSSLGIAAQIPKWLPRKPLVFQMLVELDAEDVTTLLSKEYGQFQFWGAFINAICQRESKGVSGSIAPQTIQLILQRLAAKTRYSNTFTGRLTPSDIDSAYQMVVGSVPDQSGHQLLSRMCTLGRIEPESPDRQFIDPNVLDVLRAEALVADIINMSENSGQNQWIQSLHLLGLIHASNIVRLFDLEQHCFAYLMKFGNSHNTIRLGEIFSILTAFGEESLDLKGLQISNSSIPLVNLHKRIVSNATIKNSTIDLLILDQTLVTHEHGLLIENCIAASVAGISSKEGLPDWIQSLDVISFDRVSNSSRIKESPLTSSQKLLLSIVHKIFFQPGSERKETALLKGGYGQKYSPKAVDTILKILIDSGVISRRKGDDGFVYKPVRRFTDRMNKIRSELTLSEDEIWRKITALKT
ncbi:NACHT domain-containing protein [Denitromonas iodatirespirans]|nr:NACHT domain-containing protein [Denitromonas iodatirespirans]